MRKRKKITPESMTRRQFIYAHRKLWHWLSENPDAIKPMWPGWQKNGGHWPAMDTDCPACEYKAQMFNKKNIILCNQLCLFEWPDFSCVFEGPYCNGVGLFNRWTQANYPEERSGLALQIANLPVRKLLRKEK